MMKKIIKDKKIGFRVTIVEYKKIAKAAKNDGVGLAEYCRWRSLNATSSTSI
jgi:hypothetical protein